jgi:hypothetical protein
LKGVRNFCRRSIAAETTANPPMRIELRVDARLDGPQTGTLGTPEQDILSANFGVNILLPNGNSLLLGGYFVSSAGKIWTFTRGRFGAVYGYSVPATFGHYHSLLLRVDFIARTVTYVVNGVELGSTPFPDAAALSEHLANGWVELAGPSTPINTAASNACAWKARFWNKPVPTPRAPIASPARWMARPVPPPLSKSAPASGWMARGPAPMARPIRIS